MIISRVCGVALSVVLGVFLSDSAAGQVQGSVDTAFVPPVFGVSQVYQVIEQADGKLVVVGDFSQANAVTISGLARFNIDGSVDAAFAANAGLGCDGIVNYAALQSDGKIIVNGGFGTCSGVARNTLARYNADGTLDATWDPGNLLNADIDSINGLGSASSIALLPTGKLIVGGSFQSIGPGATPPLRGNLARFNSDGTHDTTFNPGAGLTLGGLAAAAGASQLLVGGGKVYVLGSFDAVNGVSRVTGIARIDYDGNVDAAFLVAAGADINGSYGLAAVDGSGRLYISGFFFSFNGLTRKDVIRLNVDGSADASFDAGAIPGSAGVNGVFPLADGSVYITGAFNTVGGQNRRSIARLTATGAVDLTYNAGSAATNGFGNAVRVLSDGRVFIGGGFGAFQGATRASIAITSASGALDNSFVPNIGVTRGGVIMSAIAPLADGKVLVGGFFGLIDNTPRGMLVRLNADGTLDNTFNTGGLGGDNSVRAIIVRPDGKIWISGQFRSWNNVPRYRVARLNADGSLDTTFDPGLGLDNIPFAMAEQPDGKLVVAGGFTTANGNASNGIARFNSDGTVDATFTPGTGLAITASNSVSIRSLVLQSTGKMVIGGVFTSYNGVAKSNIARLNSDGTLDASFVTAANSIVRKIALLAGDKLLVGGGFTQVGAPSLAVRSRIVRLGADGAIDATFVGPGTINGSVFALQPLASGRIYVGGSFASIKPTGSSTNNTAYRQLVRLDSTGAPEPAFAAGTAGASMLYATAAPNPALPSSVTTMATYSNDASLFVGGNFHVFGGAARGNFTRLNAVKIATTTAIVSHAPLVSEVGSLYTVSYAVSPASAGSGPATGTVTVSDGSNSCIGTLPASSCNLPGTAAGTVSLTASYAGDSIYNSSISPSVSHEIAPAGQVGNITVSLAGSGSGAVVTADGRISCGAACSSLYVNGSVVTLNAVPAGGQVFAGWLGACSGVDPCVITVNGASSVSATFAPAAPTLNFDIDGNGSARGLTDGLLVMRYLLTLTGTALTSSAVATDSPTPTRLTPTDVLAYLNNLRPMLDIDGNGQVEASTDGVMLVRYLLGLRGSALTATAIGNAPRRSTTAAIESYIQSRMP